PFPYIDGLIYRTTRNIGQIPVEHREHGAALALHLAQTHRTLAQHVFELLHRAVASVRLHRALHRVSEHHLAHLYRDRSHLDHAGITARNSDRARQHRPARRDSAHDSWRARRISRAALSRSHRHAAIRRAL